MGDSRGRVFSWTVSDNLGKTQGKYGDGSMRVNIIIIIFKCVNNKLV